jgi:hypothetical protein
MFFKLLYNLKTKNNLLIKHSYHYLTIGKYFLIVKYHLYLNILLMHCDVDSAYLNYQKIIN